MRAALRLRLPLVIAAGLFVFTCLLSSASAGGSTGDTTYAQVVTASHPVGWWRLGETTGGYADSSGRTPPHPAQLQAPRSTFTRGETDCPPFSDSDGCINMTAPPKWALDGLDQSWIYVPPVYPADYSNPAFNFDGRRPFSFEVWINPNQGLNSVNQGILGSYGLDVYQHLTIGTGLYFTSPDDTITFSRRGWAAGGRTDGTAISTFSVPGEWAHVVATYDGTTMRLYLDGEEWASAASSVNVSQSNEAVSIGAMDFGWGVADYRGFFYGRIDEPAVYNRALSEDEIEAHYAAAEPVYPALTLASSSSGTSLFTGKEASFTATVENVSDASGTVLTAEVTGVNPQTISATVQGTSATFSYTGSNPGTDSVLVWGMIDGQDVESDSVEVSWLAGSSSPLQAFGLPGTSPYTRSATETWADPVNSSTGNFYQSTTDVSVQGTGVPFSFTRTYNSRDEKAGVLGQGWSASPFPSLSTDSRGNVTLKAGDGQEIGFILQEDGSLKGDKNVSVSLKKTSSGYDLVLQGQDQEIQHFDSDGRLISRLDSNGQGLHFAYSDGRLSSITDAGGREVGFAYDDQSRLMQVTLPDSTTLAFGYDGDLLASFTDQTGAVTTYAYDENGFLTSATDASGKLAFGNTYDDQGRVLKQKDAIGNESSFNWSSGHAIATDATGSEWTDAYNEEGQLSKRTDALGNESEYVYDDANNLLSLTDPLENETTMSYDERGNLLTQTDALGDTKSWTYDANNNLISETDQLGNVTRYTYDSNGNLLTETDPMGAVTTNEYDAAGRVIKVTDPLGRATRRVFDDKGNLIEKISPSGATTTYVYDELGREISETDALGHTITSEYDAAGRLIETTDQLGHSTTSTYDDAGRLIAATDAKGDTTRYRYDENGRQVEVITSDGSSTHSAYDSVGNLVASTDVLGNVTRYEYDADGRQTATISPTGERTETVYNAVGKSVTSTDPLENASSTKYDALGRDIESTDALGRKSKTFYDAAGNVVKTIDALGNVSTSSYDAAGRLISETDALGNTITSDYDAVGQLIGETDANGHTTLHAYDADGREISVTSPTGAISSSSYDAVGNLVSSTDANGHTTIYAFDAAGNQISETDPQGARSTHVYDANGNEIASTDPLGHTTTAAYDSMDRQVASTDPLGRIAKTFYDDAGNVVKTIDPLGNATTYTYDAEGRVIKVTDSLGHSTRSTYDDAGQLVATTDANGHTTTYAYDAVGQKTSVTAPDGSVTTYDYDANGNRIKRTDANGHVTAYSYNAVGNKISKTNSLGSKWVYSYDANGNLIQTKTPSGGTIDQAYNAENRLTRKSYSDGTPAVSYSYDLAGNTVSMTDGTGMTRYAYNAANRRISASSVSGSFLYSYDEDGNLLSRTYPNGLKTAYGYNDVDEMVMATAKGRTTYYTYDANGNLASTLHPNGILDERSYNTAGRTTKITGTAPHEKLLYSRSYTYDAVGNPTSLEATDAEEHSSFSGWWGKASKKHEPLSKWSETYSYDAQDRLTKACMNASCSRYYAYSYDPVGNRTTLETKKGVTTYSYDAADELVSTSEAKRVHHHRQGKLVLYTYDLNGNETQEGSTYYAYNLENKLMQAVDEGKKVSYTYTGEGLTATRSTNSETTSYSWDTSSDLGQLALETDSRGWGMFVGKDARAYTYGVGALGIVTQRESYAFHTDALGSVIRLSDSHGKLIESYRYSPYGEDYGSGYSGEARGNELNPIRFTGQYFDSVSDLYNMRAREYEPGTGRFLETDPLECDSGGGCASSYIYADDQPTVMIDPSGEGPMMMTGLDFLGAEHLDTIVSVQNRSKKHVGVTVFASGKFTRSLKAGNGANWSSEKISVNKGWRICFWEKNELNEYCQRSSRKPYNIGKGPRWAYDEVSGRRDASTDKSLIKNAAKFATGTNRLATGYIYEANDGKNSGGKWVGKAHDPKNVHVTRHYLELYYSGSSDPKPYLRKAKGKGSPTVAVRQTSFQISPEQAKSYVKIVCNKIQEGGYGNWMSIWASSESEDDAGTGLDFDPDKIAAIEEGLNECTT